MYTLFLPFFHSTMISPFSLCIPDPMSWLGSYIHRGRPTGGPLCLKDNTEERQEIFDDTPYCIIFCCINMRVKAAIDQT